ncbi:hypothetical protein [Caulobacter sp. 17J80-11]|uniref:hypothetical protein n=1 Tax=Caulobacter sp. 17J80-11 TaxID=2763502 RepID=UPI00165369DB|nr:hypothetical protein [Caulobacter sp. 17J80-11]MBC6983149.1 hypothetical protein [Caulobacter sp. 17J80-11]
MAKDHEVLFTIDALGRPRQFLRAIERTNGDLVLIPRKGEFGFDVNSGTGDEIVKVARQEEGRYSVHASDASPHRINTIKFTSRRGGRINTRVYTTDALKQRDGFAPVFYVVTPDLAAGRFDLPPNVGKTISIGGYDPTFAHVRYMAMVSNPNRAFDREKLALGESVVDYVFRRFRLTLLWTFSPFPTGRLGLHVGWENNSLPTSDMPIGTESFMSSAFVYFSLHANTVALAPRFGAEHPWLALSSRHGYRAPFLQALALRVAREQAGRGHRSALSERTT